LVFCLLGGWFETTLYIHFTRRWVKSRRHSSAPRESEDEKKAEKRAVLRSWRFCRGRVCQRGGPVQLTTSASRTYWASPLSRNAYTASLTAATARHQESVPGVGGATTPLTTSAAPISANMSSLRRVRSSVRWSKPTLLCRVLGYRLYQPVYKEEGRSFAGRVETCVGFPACVGLYGNWTWFIFLTLKTAAGGDAARRLSTRLSCSNSRNQQRPNSPR